MFGQPRRNPFGTIRTGRRVMVTTGPAVGRTGLIVHTATNPEGIAEFAILFDGDRYPTQGGFTARRLTLTHTAAEDRAFVKARKEKESLRRSMRGVSVRGRQPGCGGR